MIPRSARDIRERQRRNASAGVLKLRRILERTLYPPQLADANTSGALGDANHDGLANLLPYSAGLSPWTFAIPANNLAPTAQIAGGYLTLTFARLHTPLDIRYDVEVSGNLATWNSGPTFTTETLVTPLDSTRERVTVRDNTPIPPLRSARCACA